MRLFRRTPRLAADRRPDLAPDERVLAWAEAPSGVVVATNRGLWLPGRDARLGWHEIHKATWSGRDLVVTPAELVEQREGYAVTADRRPETYPLAEPWDVPEQVRARVTRSVAYTSHQAIPGGGGLRVVARRVPGVDGLTWMVRYDAGTDGSDADVADATAALVRLAREDAGPAPA
jgi:hypothetical protein